MSEVKKTDQFLKETKETEAKKQDMKRSHVVTVSIATFLTFCCCALFFFFLYRSEAFGAYIKKIIYILLQ